MDNTVLVSLQKLERSNWEMNTVSQRSFHSSISFEFPNMSWNHGGIPSNIGGN